MNHWLEADPDKRASVTIEAVRKKAGDPQRQGMWGVGYPLSPSGEVKP